MSNFKSPIRGHLDIFVSHNEDVIEGEISKWEEILIHGNPEGLKSFANLLNSLADLDQDSLNNLPDRGREHFHLRPKFELANSSDLVIVGRLDAKGDGLFYDRYIPNKFNKKK